jgi:hypothetical protein
VSVVALDDLVALLAEVDDREETQGSWTFGGTPAPLSRLAALDWGAGVVTPLHRWMEEVLASGLDVGNSAQDEFGVRADPLG